MSKPAPRMQAPASTGTTTDITRHFLAGVAWSAELGQREPARLSLQMQEKSCQPTASQAELNAQGCRSGQHASVQDAKDFMQTETACQVFVAFTAYAGMQKKFMQVETAGFQVFCCVHSTCRDVKESTKDAMAQCLCCVHSMCRDIAFTACKMHSTACAERTLNGSFFHSMQDAFNSLCKAYAEWKLFHNMQGALSSSRVDMYLLLLTAVSPGAVVTLLGLLKIFPE